MADKSLIWKKIQEIAGIIGAIAIPFAVLWLGPYISDKQKEIEKARQKAQTAAAIKLEGVQNQENDKIIDEEKIQREMDRKAIRIIGLLGHLSSRYSFEQLLAVKVIHRFAETNLLDLPLVMALLAMFKGKDDGATITRGDKAVLDAVEDVLQMVRKMEVKKEADALKEIVDAFKTANAIKIANADATKKAIETLRPRIYIQVQKKRGRIPEKIAKIVRMLQAKDYIARVVVTPALATGNIPVVRYFKEKDEGMAKELRKIVHDAGYKPTLKAVDTSGERKRKLLKLKEHFTITLPSK